MSMSVQMKTNIYTFYIYFKLQYAFIEENVSINYLLQFVLMCKLLVTKHLIRVAPKILTRN